MPKKKKDPEITQIQLLSALVKNLIDKVEALEKKLDARVENHYHTYPAHPPQVIYIREPEPRYVPYTPTPWYPTWWSTCTNITDNSPSVQWDSTSVGGITQSTFSCSNILPDATV
jgi:hypothetical protein